MNSVKVRREQPISRAASSIPTASLSGSGGDIGRGEVTAGIPSTRAL